MEMSSQPAQPATAMPENRHPTYDAKDLIRDGDRAQILLRDQVYILRITRAGKLILTK